MGQVIEGPRAAIMAGFYSPALSRSAHTHTIHSHARLQEDEADKTADHLLQFLKRFRIGVGAPDSMHMHRASAMWPRNPNVMCAGGAGPDSCCPSCPP